MGPRRLVHQSHKNLTGRGSGALFSNRRMYHRNSSGAREMTWPNSTDKVCASIKILNGGHAHHHAVVRDGLVNHFVDTLPPVASSYGRSNSPSTKRQSGLLGRNPRWRGQLHLKDLASAWAISTSPTALHLSRDHLLNKFPLQLASY